MEKAIKTKNYSATLMATIFGILSGIGGFIHGIGEIIQGNVAPTGLVINSWTTGPISTNMGGEPAMTIIPNLLITGIMGVIVALIGIIWSIAFVKRKNGGFIMILIFIGMLLVGGGFGPPIMGILAGVAGLGIHSSYSWSRKHLPIETINIAGTVWPWIFSICVINGIFLVVGSVILVYLFGLNEPDLFVGSFFFSVLSQIICILVGIPGDIKRGEEGK